MAESLKIRIARRGLVPSPRAHRAAKAERSTLKSQLRTYSSDADRLEMAEVLSRYPESETHRVWQGVLTESAPWGRV